MKKTLIASGFAALCGLLASCSDEKPVLNIYNWSDYMEPEVITMFEEKYGVEVVLDTFDSNEAMYNKLKSGATGYDVIFPSSYFARIMWEEGMLRELDHAKLPNLQYVDKAYMQKYVPDKDMQYSVPYMTGTTGIAYCESEVENFEPTWAMYEREDLKNRMTLLNDGRETLGAALKYLGYSLNTINQQEIDEAVAVVQKWKANIAKFENEGYKPGIASREFYLVQGYSGDILQVVEENDDEDIVYVLPQEGFSIWSDDMVIPVSADQPELAAAFINFMHDPEVARMNMEFNYYKCPNTAAYETVDEEVSGDETIFIPEELMQKGEMIKYLGADNQLYVDAWDRVKSRN